MSHLPPEDGVSELPAKRHLPSAIWLLGSPEPLLLSSHLLLKRNLPAQLGLDFWWPGVDERRHLLATESQPLRRWPLVGVVAPLELRLKEPDGNAGSREVIATGESSVQFVHDAESNVCVPSLDCFHDKGHEFGTERERCRFLPAGPHVDVDGFCFRGRFEDPHHHLLGLIRGRLSWSRAWTLILGSTEVAGAPPVQLFGWGPRQVPRVLRPRLEVIKRGIDGSPAGVTFFVRVRLANLCARFGVARAHVDVVALSLDQADAVRPIGQHRPPQLLTRVLPRTHRA